MSRHPSLLHTNIRQTVERYNSAFETCDLDTITDILHPDVTWTLNGAVAHEGKSDVVERLRGDLDAGRAEVRPTITVADDATVIMIA